MTNYLSNMENKFVVSLELSKKMREMGFPSDTHFEWFEGYGKSGVKPAENHKISGFDYIPAPHVGELGEWLGKVNWDKLNLKITPTYNILIDGIKFWESPVNEAEGRAKLLIYITEQFGFDPKSLHPLPPQP